MSLEENYQAISDNTLRLWQANLGCGETRPERYDPLRLAIASGIRPVLTDQVQTLLAELHDLTARDPAADAMPADSFHLTFLPITMPIYEEDPDTTDLEALWQPYKGTPLVVRELRLVALPSQLLLAGIVDDDTKVMRERFCADVLNSRWRELLIRRHANSPLPAPFWHSTLLRYQAERLPQQLRDFFARHRSSRFGSLEAELQLCLVNYNWSFQQEIGR